MADTTGPAMGGNGDRLRAPGTPVAVDASAGDWVRQAVARYERPLCAYVAHLTGNVERSRDVVQETFVRLCSAERGQVEGRLAQWLFTVARNLAIDWRRKEGRVAMLSETETQSYAGRPDAAPTPADAAERHDAVSAVLRELAALPPVQQEVVRLKFQHGLSYREIGEVLNLTTTNVGFILHTALKTLRSRLVTPHSSDAHT